MKFYFENVKNHYQSGKVVAEFKDRLALGMSRKVDTREQEGKPGRTQLYLQMEDKLHSKGKNSRKKGPKVKGWWLHVCAKQFFSRCSQVLPHPTVRKDGPHSSKRQASNTYQENTTATAGGVCIWVRNIARKML